MVILFLTRIVPFVLLICLIFSAIVRLIAEIRTHSHA